ncbi:Cellulose synthase-like protein G3 [Acorus gramineus]|uniref:Cellulose synthase-like protein G3 n=1 Tax=Acorus gramineus TaxID=55184 RepID=A0AAV9A274_ACOGR|nr:Cellulose synthase-like protein G3 [Acorus gramineus]
MVGENKTLPLHTCQIEPNLWLNRGHAVLYSCALLALFYHRLRSLLFQFTTFFALFLHLSLFVSDLVFAFMWAVTQAFHMRRVHRQTFPENLSTVLETKDMPKIDVFVCTADPHKEPPMSVVNTVLSVMAFDYPGEKVCVYVSDDGGSQLTLFAFVEMEKFARHWLPFCREMGMRKRSPEAYFASSEAHPHSDKIKMMYECMKERVEHVMEMGRVTDDLIHDEDEPQIFTKWTSDFTRSNHPTVIQVLLNSQKDVDVMGQAMPSLIYLSREKRPGVHHHFKAGALNTLTRVSAAMTNAPIILTLDCDMNSNDPQAPRQALCHLSDPEAHPNLAFVQFPQYFRGIDRNDIYGCEWKGLFQIYPVGMDGLRGPNHVGTGCFFRRRALHKEDNVSSLNLSDQSIRDELNLERAHNRASCTYENDTEWGVTMGFRYGSVVEDYYTGYRLHCEGWVSIFCDPQPPAFMGDAPFNLNDTLSQTMRWSVGLLEVAFSKYCTIIFGVKKMNLLMGMCYSHYAFWPIWSIPMITYAFLPQLALLNGTSLFPKASEKWMYLYAYLFISAFIQDLISFLRANGTLGRWYNNQRMWMIRGVTCFPFGFFQFFLQKIGVSSSGFNVTSKVSNDEQSKRYARGIFDFGVVSPFFVSLSMVALINFAAFWIGLMRVLEDGYLNSMFVQLFLSGYVMVNCWPVYEAMVLRNDSGILPRYVKKVSVILSMGMFTVAYFAFGMQGISY